MNNPLVGENSCETFEDVGEVAWRETYQFVKPHSKYVDKTLCENEAIAIPYSVQTSEQILGIRKNDKSLFMNTNDNESENLLSTNNKRTDFRKTRSKLTDFQNQTYHEGNKSAGYRSQKYLEQFDGSINFTRSRTTPNEYVIEKYAKFVPQTNIRLI
ncbi:hypothetical protein SNEBB_003699 [Seison nebaliae]|nr:hypothetical protein SNEBB_003699 [Seison nebaliae]